MTAIESARGETPAPESAVARGGRGAGNDHATRNLTKDELDRELDEGLVETFPASDPVAVSQTTAAGSGHRAGATNKAPPTTRLP